MTKRLLDNIELLSSLQATTRAVAEGNESALAQALARVDAVHRTSVTTQVRQVACDLQQALDRFKVGSKLIDLAQRQVPDARLRLEHVLRLTGDAAHRTLDLVERSGPLAEKTAQEAEQLIALQHKRGAETQPISAQLTNFLTLVATNMTTVKRNLDEVLITQGYQDLSGQIIRGVMKLIEDLELALAELLRIAGPGQPIAAADSSSSAGFGPQVPGIESQSGVDGQQDIDALLSKLGV